MCVGFAFKRRSRQQTAEEEDRMRSNAEMANFMASVNQTRLQLDLVSGHLSEPAAAPFHCPMAESQTI